MFTRNASECRANEPRTCYYHGAIITMNEATERFRKTGDPEALDVYYKSRQRVEAAEDELRKQQWLKEADAIATPAAPAAPVQSTPESTPARNNHAKSEQKGRYTKGTGQRYNPRKPAQQRSNKTSKFSPVPASENYDERAFPAQTPVLKNERGEDVTFVRHDKAKAVPKGIMLATSRSLTPNERQQLLGMLKYQHTMNTRENNKAKIIEDKDVVVDHSSRSVYIKSQFRNDGSQLPAFHENLGQMIQTGSVRRQDGTQKFPPFAQDVKVVAYYAS